MLQQQQNVPSLPSLEETLNPKNVSSLSSEVSHQLRNVFLCLAGAMLTSCIGVIFYIQTSFSPIMSFLGCIALIIALAVSQPRTNFNIVETSPSIPSKKTMMIRVLLLLGFGFFQGSSIGSLVQQALEMDSKLVFIAFFGSLSIFGSFFLSALFARRKSYLFIGGFLWSCLSNLVWLCIFNLFFQTEFIFLISLYGGLVLFCGYVLYDTQVMIEKINMGDKDYVNHAVALYLDFINIFIRVLIILMRNHKK